MTKKLPSIFAFGVALALTGCGFTSDKPLIGSSQADYPLKDGAHYVHYELDAATGQWQKTGEANLHLQNGNYQLAGMKNSSGNTDASHTFLVKAIGDGYYIAQEDYYDLLKIDGNTVYVYRIRCEPDFDRKLAATGVIDRIGSAEGGGDDASCIVSSLDNLTQVFHIRLAYGAAAEEKYVAE